MKLFPYTTIPAIFGLTITSILSQDQALPPIQMLDQLTVTANRSDQTLFEQITPATVLNGQDLLINMEPTLGETLAKQPGVSSTYFGPGASRPILRGLGDDRLRILQNGVSVIDVSNVSPDHAVATDPLTLSSVEIVRGPATILYGPNSIGGVVNMQDNRIAEEAHSSEFPSGSFGYSAGSADSSLASSGQIQWGAGPMVFHLDGFRRDAENIEIPGFARSAQLRTTDAPGTAQPRNELPNSFSNSKGAGLGASYIFDGGFIGLSYSGMNSSYGTVGEPDVTIGLQQRRWEMRGGMINPTTWLREINFALGYSDYTHTEFEGPAVGTIFELEGFNGRLELMHEEIAGFEGTLGYEFQTSDFSALGAEAFLPPTETSTHSLFLFEEKVYDQFRLQLGARYDYQSSDSSTNPAFGPGQSRDFGAFSASAGIIYNPTEDYAVSLSLAYTQRPPTYVELYADGPHLATSVFEIGDPSLNKEEAFSIDLALRKKTGRVTGAISGFYYRFTDFVNLSPTGGIDPNDGLPIFAYEASDATFYGGEIEATFHLLNPIDENTRATDERLDLILRADYVHAEDRSSDEPIPRIPPFRTTAILEYGNGPLTARIEGQYCAEQDRNANFETPTDAYFLLTASVSYQVPIGPLDTTLYLKGVNLTDEEARLSTSYLKDVAPLAGRGVVAGLRAEF